MLLVNGILDLYCAGLGLILLITPVRRIGPSSRATRMSRNLFQVIVLMLLCDGLALCFFSGAPEHFAVYRVLEGVSFVCFYTTLALYTWYLLEVMPTGIGSKRRILLAINTTSCAVGMLMWCSNCLRPFFFDIAARQMTNPAIYKFSILPGLIPVLGDLLLILRNRKWLKLTDLFLLLLMPTLPLLSSLVGQIVPGLSLQYALVFAGAILNHRYFDEVLDRELIKKELDLQENRMRMTIARVKPHYIYNVLTTIYYLCEKDPAKAQEAISNFAAYLRETSRSLEKKQPVPFSWELELIENYLKLEKLRFGERLTYELDIRERDFSIVPFTAQQLVENAVKHGMHAQSGVHIRIGSARTEGGFQVLVQDNGVGFVESEVAQDEPSGLRNIRDLLALNNSGTLTIESKPGKGTDALLFFRGAGN